LESELPQDWRNLTKIASSWTEFISTLFEYIDPDETEWEKIIRTRNVELLKKYTLSNNDFDAK